MSSSVSVTCFKCGKLNTFPERVGFRAECEFCKSDARVCKNCRFYDVKAYNECREPSAEVVLEKERSNRCEYFQASSAEKAGKNPADELLSAAEALFKKKD
jgi:hypothetical protein